MSAGAILAIAILAMAILMMWFRKRWLAKFNIAATNRITGLFAGWLPGFGILTHVGRRSGKVYRTPVNVFRAQNGFSVALTYSSQSEWVQNVLARAVANLRPLAGNIGSRRRSCAIPRGGGFPFRQDSSWRWSERMSTWSFQKHSFTLPPFAPVPQRTAVAP